MQQLFIYARFPNLRLIRAKYWLGFFISLLDFYFMRKIISSRYLRKQNQFENDL